MATGQALKVTTPSDREIKFTRFFDARRAHVFEAHTRPELVRRWLLGPPGWTMPVCEIDLRVGGKYRYVWRHEGDGREMTVRGVYRELAPPDRIVHTELFDEDWTGGETTVTTVFTDEDDGTRMTMVVVYSSREARDGALQSGMIEGMEAGYQRLDELLASGDA